MEEESLSCFLCEESESCLGEDEEETSVDDSNSFLIVIDPCIEEEEEEEYIRMLLDRETSSGWFRGDPQCRRHDDDHRSPGDWIRRSRIEAFSWILRTRALFGFQFQTAYLSMTYYDQFLSRRSPVSENNWAIRLLAVACLSLAAKMEEIHIPLLSEFNMKDHSFRCEVVQGMELLVLKTLEWRMESITPFLFLHFFVSKLSDHPLKADIVPKAVRLILGITREIDILKHRPSTIAAAAALAASCNDSPKEVLECNWGCCSFHARLDIDAVFSCYGIMRGLDVDKALNVGPTTPPDPTSSVASSESSISIASSSGSNGNRKRKRLTFDEDDRNREAPDDGKWHRLEPR